MKRVSKAEWEQLPKGYKTIIHGQRYRLARDDERGTVLVPVEVVDDNEPAESENG